MADDSLVKNDQRPKSWLTRLIERLAEASDREFGGKPPKCHGNCLECMQSMSHGKSRSELWLREHDA